MDHTALNAICPSYTMFPLELPVRILKGWSACGGENAEGIPNRNHDADNEVLRRIAAIRRSLVHRNLLAG